MSKGYLADQYRKPFPFLSRSVKDSTTTRLWKRSVSYETSLAIACGWAVDGSGVDAFWRNIYYDHPFLSTPILCHASGLLIGKKLLDSRFSGNTSSYGLTSFFVSSADQPGLEERFILWDDCWFAGWQKKHRRRCRYLVYVVELSPAALWHADNFCRSSWLKLQQRIGENRPAEMSS